MMISSEGRSLPEELLTLYLYDVIFPQEASAKK
jgi:hypothetical protein